MLQQERVMKMLAGLTATSDKTQLSSSSICEADDILEPCVHRRRVGPTEINVD